MSPPVEAPEALTDRAYWRAFWQAGTLPRPVDPADRSVRGRARARIFAALAEALGPAVPGAPPRRLIEIGAGASSWLPAFARTLGFEVAGIDYEPLGCEQARAILAEAGVAGTIVEADAFDPPQDLLCAFDAVISLGVVEHFADTAAAIGAFARFARPGGRVVTLIPNMRGLMGFVQRRVSRPIFERHVPLSQGQLVAAHEAAGLRVEFARPVLFANLLVLNPGEGRWRRPFHAVVGPLEWGVRALDRAGVLPPPNRFTSPYFLVAATRPPAP